MLGDGVLVSQGQRTFDSVGWLMLWFLLLLSSSGCLSSSPAMEQPSSPPIAIGVVDKQWLLKESIRGKQTTEALTAFMKDRQTLIDLEQKELRSLESQLLRQRSILSQVARQQREEQFRRRMMEYQQKVGTMNQEVQAKQGQLLAEFRKHVDAVVEAIAKQSHLALVIEKGVNTPTRYHEPRLDISREVLEALNQQSL